MPTSRQCQASSRSAQYSPDAADRAKDLSYRDGNGSVGRLPSSSAPRSTELAALGRQLRSRREWLMEF